MSHAGVTLDHSIEANVKRLSPDFICLRLLSGLIEEERCSNCVGGVIIRRLALAGCRP